MPSNYFKYDLKLHISYRIVEEIKRAAREMFPRETWGYLLGRRAGNTFEVEELFVPDGDELDRAAKTTRINIGAHWELEAMEYAKENGLQIVGTVHSHPWTVRELKLYRQVIGTPDRSQSESDFETYPARLWVYGVCRVLQEKGGRLRSSVRFWGPMIPVEVRVI